MKLKYALPAILFATVSSLPAATHAADADKAPAADVQTDKPAAKKMKPHSHMEEKMGVAPAVSQMDNKPAPEEKADKDKSKHLHPRDGK